MDTPSSLRSPTPQAVATAVTSLLRAADRAARSLEVFFQGYGLTGQQFNVLRILRGAGRQLPTMEVADRLLQKTPALTGILDRLERKALIQRERSEADRRVWLCSITDQGRDLLAEIDEHLGAANLRALASAQDDLQELVEALRGTREAE